MKKSIWLIVACSFLFVNSCKEKTKNSVSQNEDEIVDSKAPLSVVKDSITYYNGNQKQINLKYGTYFGFVFETKGQELVWKMDPKMDDNISYISESYIPEVDTPEKKSNGKQYFTFTALKSGKAKVTFRTKDGKAKKTIVIHIK